MSKKSSLFFKKEKEKEEDFYHPHLHFFPFHERQLFILGSKKHMKAKKNFFGETPLVYSHKPS